MHRNTRFCGKNQQFYSNIPHSQISSDAAGCEICYERREPILRTIGAEVTKLLTSTVVAWVWRSAASVILCVCVLVCLSIATQQVNSAWKYYSTDRLDCVTWYPTQEDIFTTVGEEGILLDKFLNKIDFNLEVVNGFQTWFWIWKDYKVLFSWTSDYIYC